MKKANREKKKGFKIVGVVLFKHIIQGGKMPIIIVQGVNCNWVYSLWGFFAFNPFQYAAINSSTNLSKG